MDNEHGSSHSMSLRISYQGSVAAVRMLSVFADVIIMICSFSQNHGDTISLSVQQNHTSVTYLSVFLWHKIVFPLHTYILDSI